MWSLRAARGSEILPPGAPEREGQRATLAGNERKSFQPLLLGSVGKKGLCGPPSGAGLQQGVCALLGNSHISRRTPDQRNHVLLEGDQLVPLCLGLCWF